MVVAGQMFVRCGLVLVLASVVGCHLGGAMSEQNSFVEDLGFLKEHTDVLVLNDGDSEGRVAVIPSYQGRVMTSTTGGDSSPSFGWINYDLIASGELRPQINAFGGEDRFWMGPEAGQYAIFFDPDSPFDMEHWQTPPLIDAVPYEVVSRDDRQVSFRKVASIDNYAGTQFDLQIDRTIRIIDRTRGSALLGLEPLTDVEFVAFESENTIRNTGVRAWTKERGLLSIWIPGMFRPSSDTTIVIPVVPGSEEVLGAIVNDAYFGKVPDDKIRVEEEAVFFSGDGTHRCKIGVAVRRARDVLGSYNAAEGLLTLVQYTLPDGATDYVNSMWEVQEDPFGGDVVNSYNDGPPEPGKPQLGPFYELETSSPGAALLPGQELTHIHRTFHLKGTPAQLDPIARQLLGTSLDQIVTALGGRTP